MTSRTGLQREIDLLVSEEVAEDREEFNRRVADLVEELMTRPGEEGSEHGKEGVDGSGGGR